MIYPTERLRREDIEEFQIITSFLNGRFQTLDVIEWALGLGRKDIVPRLAILESRRKQTEYQLKNPWLSAWHLIEESWEYQGISNHSSTDIYDIKRRLEAGDRSGSLISDLVAYVSTNL
jgi:hypothetical protein